jgi:hypothetical protein
VRETVTFFLDDGMITGVQESGPPTGVLTGYLDIKDALARINNAPNDGTGAPDGHD